MNWKQFIGGLFILLLIPSLVLGGFALYVHWINGFPQKGLLNTSVEPAVVLPWEDAEYSLSFRGDLLKQPDNRPVPPADIALVVDVSGSMCGSLPDMTQAARQAISKISESRPDSFIRLALIPFESSASIQAPWTGDTQRLYDELRALSCTGGTNGLDAVLKLKELMDTARPEATKVAIYYTDGAMSGGDQMIEEARQLRNKGILIYCVSEPSSGSSSLMVELTGSAEYVLNPGNSLDMMAKFENIIHGIFNKFGENARIYHMLHSDHFSVPSGGKDYWRSEQSGDVLKIVKEVGILPYGVRLTYTHPLDPHSLGLWTVGVKPIHFEFFNNEDQAFTVLPPPREPRILVITWLLLFLAALPALLWILKFIMEFLQKSKETIVKPAPPDVRIPLPPGGLPALPVIRDDRKPPVPTLFIGLGGTGYKALEDIQENLKNVHIDDKEQPYRFLWFDPVGKEIQHHSSVELEGYPVQKIIAPKDIRHVRLPDMSAVPEHLKWFPVHQYFDLPGEKLNLSDGAKGDRALARLALFRWLKKEDSEILSALSDSCQKLVDMPSPDNTRQVVILASNDGGTGSGWFLDCARLCRRITRDFQQQGKTAFVPDIIGVLCRDQENPLPENRNALRLEMESSSLCGAFPQKLCYVPGNPLLDQSDTENPFNWALTVGGSDRDEASAKCGELCAVLVESLPRNTLLYELVGAGRHCVDISLSALKVRPLAAHEQVKRDILRRILGQDVLLDIEPAPDTGFTYRQYTEEQIRAALRQWADTEPQGSPWRQVLLTGVDSRALPRLIQSVQEVHTTSPEWFKSAFSASLTRMFHGCKSRNSSEWDRIFYPGLAKSVLQLLQQEVENRIVPNVESSGGTRETRENIRLIAELAASAVTHLDQWLQEFNQFFNETFATERIQHQRQDRDLNFRKYIDPVPDEKQVRQWSATCFEKWLGSVDSVSAIRERLYFAAVPEDDAVRIVLRSYIEASTDFSKARDAGHYIRQIAQTLARQIPISRIEHILAQLDETSRNALGKSLIRTGANPDHVLLTVPSAFEEKDVVESFKNRIPQPPNHGERRDAHSDDHSAVRRLEIAEPETIPASDKISFVEMKEQIAENLRIRAQNTYHIYVPQFPPELRIAVAHSEQFQSFTNAYRAGFIVKKEDSSGKNQWTFSQTGQFLTFGDETTLAKAAANYVWYVQNPPQTFAETDKGDFSEMKQWMERKGAASGDLLVLIAMDRLYNS